MRSRKPTSCKQCNRLRAEFGDGPMVPPVLEPLYPQVRFGCGIGVIVIDYPDGRTEVLYP